MAKISALPDAGGITDDDYLLIVDDADGTPVTKRVDAPDARSYFGVQTVGLTGRYPVPSPTGYFPLLGGLRSSSLNDSFAAAQAYYFPFMIPATVTVSALSVDCITLAAGVTRKYAIFSPTATNGIGTLIPETSIVFDMSTTGYKTQNFSSPVTFAPGIYWLGQRNSGNSSQVRSFNQTEAVVFMSAPGAAIEADSGIYATNGASYAAFPETNPGTISWGQGSENPQWIIATQV